MWVTVFMKYFTFFVSFIVSGCYQQQRDGNAMPSWEEKALSDFYESSNYSKAGGPIYFDIKPSLYFALAEVPGKFTSQNGKGACTAPVKLFLYADKEGGQWQELESSDGKNHLVSLNANKNCENLKRSELYYGDLELFSVADLFSIVKRAFNKRRCNDESGCGLYSVVMDFPKSAKLNWKEKVVAVTFKDGESLGEGVIYYFSENGFSYLGEYRFVIATY